MKKAPVQKDDCEKGILELIRLQHWTTFEGLCEIGGCSRRRIREALNSLVTAGKLKKRMWSPLPGGTWEKHGSGRKMIWFLASCTYEGVRRYE